MASTQPLLQLRHSRIHSPVAALFAMSGSVKSERPYAIISASPSSSIFSPAATDTTRPTVATGIETTFFTRLATGRVQLYGTSPIGGMVSPMFPVWFACATCIMSTPAFSRSFANSTPSSASKPPFPRRVPSGFTVIIGSLYSIISSGAASLIALTTSSA